LLTNAFGPFIVCETLASHLKLNRSLLEDPIIQASNFPQEIQMPSHFFEIPISQLNWTKPPMHPTALSKRVSAPELMERKMAPSASRLKSVSKMSAVKLGAMKTLSFLKSAKPQVKQEERLSKGKGKDVR
jgi:hypothetical protein